jgi:hypothetical protein
MRSAGYGFEDDQVASSSTTKYQGMKEAVTEAALLFLLQVAGLLLYLLGEFEDARKRFFVIRRARDGSVFGSLGSKLSNFLLFAHAPNL